MALRLGCVLALMPFVTTCMWAEASNPQPDSQGVYSPGDGVNPPKLVKAVPAVYPLAASQPLLKESRTLSVVVGVDHAPRISTIRAAPPTHSIRQQLQPSNSRNSNMETSTVSPFRSACVFGFLLCPGRSDTRLSSSSSRRSSMIARRR